MTQHIEVTSDGAVQCLRMNRPEKKNALTREMYCNLMRSNTNQLAARTRVEAEAFAKCLQSKEARMAFQNFLATS